LAANVRYHAKFHQSRSKDGRDMVISQFFLKWRPSAIWDLLVAYWEDLRPPLDGLYRYAKFG